MWVGGEGGGKGERRRALCPGSPGWGGLIETGGWATVGFGLGPRIPSRPGRHARPAPDQITKAVDNWGAGRERLAGGAPGSSARAAASRRFPSGPGRRQRSAGARSMPGARSPRLLGVESRLLGKHAVYLPHNPTPGSCSPSPWNTPLKRKYFRFRGLDEEVMTTAG